MVECEERFDELPINTKLAPIARNGDVGFREFFIQIRTSGKLTNSWAELKELIVEYCTGKSIYYLPSYSDEPWSEYFLKMQDAARKPNINDECVLKRLRDIWMPEKYQILIHGGISNLEEIIEQIRAWENMADKHSKVQKDKECKNEDKFRTYKYSKRIQEKDNESSTTYKDPKEVVCFSCNKPCQNATKL